MTNAIQYADLALFGNVQMGYVTNAAATPLYQPLLAPDFVQGLRFDINRPLGDGVDNDGNGVVDEPTEILAELIYYPTTNASTGRKPMAPPPFPGSTRFLRT